MNGHVGATWAMDQDACLSNTSSSVYVSGAADYLNIPNYQSGSTSVPSADRPYTQYLWLSGTNQETHGDESAWCSTCPSGDSVCSGVCVNESTDPDNCGGCGVTCTGGKTCQAGSCECPAGETYCPTSGTCANLSNDADNCGACGNVCAGASADSGAATCESDVCVCPYGTACTGTVASTNNLAPAICVNESDDPTNCGSCGNTCAGTQSCVTSGTSGVCSGGTTVTPETPGDVASDSTLGGQGQTIAFDNSVAVPQNNESTPFGLFSLSYGTGPQPAYQFLKSTGTPTEIGTQTLSGIVISPTSRSSGDDTLWGIQIGESGSAHVWSNTFTGAVGSVAYNMWSEVANDVPGNAFAGQLLAAGMNSAGNVVFATSELSGFTSAPCTGNSDCGYQEVCTANTCSCANGAYLWQLNGSGWTAVQGPTPHTASANACVYAMSIDEDTTGGSYGDLLVLDPTGAHAFWALTTTGAPGQSASAWGTPKITSVTGYGQGMMAAYNSQLVMGTTSSLELVSFCAGSPYCTSSGTVAQTIDMALPYGGTCAAGNGGSGAYSVTFDPNRGDLYWVADATTDTLCEMTACQLFNACEIATGTSSNATSCPNPGSCCRTNSQCASNSCVNNTCQ